MATAVTAALLLGGGLSPDVAEGKRTLYTADGVEGGPGTISQFLTPPAGTPRPLIPRDVATGADPMHITVASDGRFAWASAAEVGLVSGYTVGPAGRLEGNGAPVAAAGPGTHGVVVTPDGRSVYTASQGPGEVSQYDVATDGTLSPKSPPSLPTGAGASGVAVTPDGTSAYVTNLNANTVSQFDIDPETGGLTPKSPAALETPAMPGGLGVDPAGESLYVATLSGRVAQFDVHRETGALTPKSPFSVRRTGAGAAGIAITPDGRYLYTPDAATDTASQFEIRPKNGTLKPLDPPSVTAGDGPEGAAISPDGDSLYVANAGDASVSHFSIRASGRLIAASPPTATGPSPHGLVLTPNQGPTARFRVLGERPPRAGRKVRFAAGRSTDADGRIAAYRWRFGDGGGAREVMSRTAHRFRRPGRYTVRLVVRDQEGCSSQFIYTGQSAYCNGGRRAADKKRIRVLPKKR